MHAHALLLGKRGRCAHVHAANGGNSATSADAEEVDEDAWRHLLNDDGQVVRGSDGSPARILVSAKYCKGDMNNSFSTMC